MTALLATFFGFLASSFPELLKIFTSKQDKSHEIKVLQLQIEREKAGLSYKAEEVQARLQAVETAAIYKTYNTGIRWVDALNGTVRPVIAYAYFLLYAVIKAIYVYQDIPWMAWTDDDGAIFGTIVGFYFGMRSFKKK